MRGIVGLQALVSWITSKRNSMNPDSGASKWNWTQQQGIYLLVLLLVPVPERVSLGNINKDFAHSTWDLLRWDTPRQKESGNNKSVAATVPVPKLWSLHPLPPGCGPATIGRSWPVENHRTSREGHGILQGSCETSAPETSCFTFFSLLHDFLSRPLMLPTVGSISMAEPF